MGLAVWTCDHDHVAIRIAQPHLAVLRRRIDMRLFDDLGAQVARARDGGIEVSDFEPQHDAMSDRRRVRIDKIRMILLIPRV